MNIRYVATKDVLANVTTFNRCQQSAGCCGTDCEANGGCLQDLGLALEELAEVEDRLMCAIEDSDIA